jgi:dihydrofolate synthase/folylpolyglutamate synthase
MSTLRSLHDWLTYIERQHPQSISLGLERVRLVLSRLTLPHRACVFTVGGTNGKGSTTAMLEAMLHAAGYRTGRYSSPHLLRYNERVRVDACDVSDATLVEGFEAVERAREGIALTYFEYGTLAAIWTFAQLPLDAWVMEVGLGGRLDAVNVLDADCAVLTGVALDHMDYLGDTREAIGYEKAGIFRAQQPAVIADL